MRYPFLMVILAAGSLAGMGCEQATPRAKPAARREPRTSQEPVRREGGVKKDRAPLLLDDGPDVALSAGAIADNSRCYVCHINYMQEDIAVVHAQANIGCKDCHGDSDAHIADESWSWGGKGTAPDIMYRPANINLFCTGCHPEEKIEMEEHEPFFAATTEKKHCTDCHGQHRLAHRRCKWK